MSDQKQTNRRFSASYALHQLHRSSSSLPEAVPGIVLRAALATVLMYLLFIANELMGVTGVVLISIFFLVSLFAPALIRAHRLRKARQKRSVEVGEPLAPVAQTED